MKKEILGMLFTGIIYVGLGFAAGFMMSELLIEDTMPPAEAVLMVETPAPILHTPAPSYSPELEYYGVRYIVAASGDELILYEADGINKKVLRKSKFNMNAFPDNDIKELQNGINTGTLEGALEVWESFVE